MKTLKRVFLVIVVLLLMGSDVLAGILFQTTTTELVSVASDGTQAFEASDSASISSDGRYVAFHSWAENLVPEDNNGITDIFVQDRQSGETRLISVGSDGAQGFGNSDTPSISGNGQVVAFQSYSSNLVDGDVNNTSDVFVRLDAPCMDYSPWLPLASK